MMSVIAVPVYRNRVAPAFDFSQKVLLVQHGRDGKGNTSEIPFMGFSDAERLQALMQAGVTTLVCGGISDGLQGLLEKNGIRVIWGVAGAIEEVLEAYQSDRLNEAKFNMPGNCGER